MGACRTVLLASLGPLLFWAGLMAHLVYRIGTASPEQAPAPAKSDPALVKSRAEMMAAFRDIYRGRDDTFFDRYGIVDMTWEDPTEKYLSRAETAAFLRLWGKLANSVEFEVHSESHTKRQAAVDWTIKVTTVVTPNMPFTLRLRSILIMEPGGGVAGGEKISAALEEWNGCPLLNERSVQPALVGWLHAKWRRFFGVALVKFVQLVGI